MIKSVRHVVKRCCVLRGLGTVGVGSKREGVPSPLRHGRDEGRGHPAPEEPLLPVPDRAAGALQGGAVLRTGRR